MEYINKLPESFYSIWWQVWPIAWVLIKALIALIIGLIVASGLKMAVERIIEALKIDSLIRKSGAAVFIERGGLRVNAGKFFGALIYWFIIIVFAWTIVKELGLEGLAMFLQQVVDYAPNIITAALILVATFIVAQPLKSLVKSSVASAKLHASNFLSNLTWWAIVIFGFVTALIQLGIAPMLLNTIITGLVAMIALAGGIAFGLGGKDYATHLIAKFREKIE